MSGNQYYHFCELLDKFVWMFHNITFHTMFLSINALSPLVQ
jgi:hypothetical protein